MVCPCQDHPIPSHVSVLPSFVEATGSAHQTVWRLILTPTRPLSPILVHGRHQDPVNVITWVSRGSNLPGSVGLPGEHMARLLPSFPDLIACVRGHQTALWLLVAACWVRAVPYPRGPCPPLVRPPWRDSAPVPFAWGLWEGTSPQQLCGRCQSTGH